MTPTSTTTATFVRGEHHAPADLEGALAELGLEVHRSTDDEVTCFCPGHLKRLGREESNPSWSVNRSTGLHNCYSCGFKGTFLDLVMELLYPNDVFRAARWVRQFGLNLARAADLVPYDERHTREVEQVELVPETRLAMYPDVPEWALEARLLDRESVDHYGVRWNDKNQSWIIPIRLPAGDLLGWQEKWQGKRRVLNRPKDMQKSVTMFGLHVFPVGEPAVLVESPLDVCRLHAAGFTGGLATFGAEVSRRQRQMLLMVTDEVVVALDDDPPGRRAAAEFRSGRWERGKMAVPPIRRYVDLRYFNYGTTGEKDIGGMAAEDITRGLYEAQHWLAAVLGTEEEERRVRRRAEAVPGPRRGTHGRPRHVPARRGRGHRQDAHDHRRPGGAR